MGFATVTSSLTGFVNSSDAHVKIPGVILHGVGMSGPFGPYIPVGVVVKVFRQRYINVAAANVWVFRSNHAKNDQRIVLQQRTVFVVK